MPSGIILQSASHGATEEAVNKVLEANGYEVDKPEPKTEENAEPQRDQFETEEAFEEAHVAWQDAQPKTEEEDNEDEPVETLRRKGKFAKRVDKLTAPLRREISDLRKQLEEAKSGKKIEEPQEVKRPVRADFKSDEEFQDALIEWGVARANEKNAVRAAEDEQRAQLETNLANYRSQVEDFKESHDDWDEVVNQDLPMHQSVQLAVMEEDNGAEVIYYLGKHPEFTRKLHEMSPLSAVMEVGRLSQRLKTGAGRSPAATGGTTEKPKPRVPAPITPVRTAAASTSPTTKTAKTYREFKSAVRAGRQN